MEKFKGKAIYNPSGKANEYSYWACNFYVGCSNECTYCYLKKGLGANILGGNTPKLKKCFKDETHALDIFMYDAAINADELKKHGLFFSFTTDPMLEQTRELTLDAVQACNGIDIPVKILTKKADFLPFLEDNYYYYLKNSLISFGFTLTGHDELEPYADSNSDRIKTMEKCKELGFKTFASIEPIIDFPSAKEMIEKSIEFCDLYKIGLESGKKYDVKEAKYFVEWLKTLKKPKIYLKESLQKLIKCSNSDLDNYFVERNYNIFKSN